LDSDSLFFWFLFRWHRHIVNGDYNISVKIHIHIHFSSYSRQRCLPATPFPFDCSFVLFSPNLGFLPTLFFPPLIAAFVLFSPNLGFLPTLFFRCPLSVRNCIFQKSFFLVSSSPSLFCAENPFLFTVQRGKRMGSGGCFPSIWVLTICFHLKKS